MSTLKSDYAFIVKVTGGNIKSYDTKGDIKICFINSTSWRLEPAQIFRPCFLFNFKEQAIRLSFNDSFVLYVNFVRLEDFSRENQGEISSNRIMRLIRENCHKTQTKLKFYDHKMVRKFPWEILIKIEAVKTGENFAFNSRLSCSMENIWTARITL